MTTTRKAQVARAVARAERYCSREKAIQLVALQSPYSIREVREAVQQS